jgi:hypothetical protein
VAWFECGAASGYRYFDYDASSTRGAWAASPNASAWWGAVGAWWYMIVIPFSLFFNFYFVFSFNQSLERLSLHLPIDS